MAVLDTFADRQSRENVEMWLPFPRGDTVEKRCLWVSTAYIAIDDMERVLVCVQDITERKRAEEALQESESFTRAVMDHLPIGVAVNAVDPAVEFLYMNDNFPRFYRTTREALADPDAFWEVVYEDPVFRQEIKKRVLEDCASGDPERMHWEDVPIARKGETTTYISARNTPVPGKPLMISTVWDITERKQIEQTLEESQNRLQSIFRVAPTGIGVVCDRILLEVNAHLCEMTGYTAAELIGQNSRILYPTQEDFNYVGIEKYRQIHEIGTGTVETRWRRKDGAILDILLASTVLDTADISKGITFTALDITERKQMEDALKESEEKYRLLVENANEVIMVAQDGQIRFVNRKVIDLISYTPEELIEKPFVDFIHPKDREIVLERHLKRLEGKEVPPVYPFRIVDKAGETKWVEINAVRIEWKGRQATLNFLVDITERKQAEEEREKLQNQLIQAQKMESVGRLAGGVAHDFNNMLGVILGRTEMMLTGITPGDSLYAELEEIQKAAERSADLTRQLLAFARKQIIAPRVLDLNDTVEGMLKMLRRLIGEDIDLVWKPDADLWPIKMDPAQIDQILANLCVNARGAISDVGKVTIETQNAVLDQDYCADRAGFVPGSYILLAVSDDGCGMDEATQAQIFEPFFTTRGVGEGTGLGLATVYGIVKQNDGFINVYSELEKGTTFKIYIPRHDGSALGEAMSDSKKVPGGRGETVLLVEDDRSILSMGKAMLEKLGYTVLQAENPNRALDISKAHEGKIHLLMTDVVMPQMSGRDLALQMKERIPEIQTLFMSGYTANVIAHRGILHEEVHFIQKPFSMKDLAFKVSKALKDR
jgi:PAS domain S-box-containing protein